MLSLIFSTSLAFAQTKSSGGTESSAAQRWQALIASGKVDAADRLCTAWTTSSELNKKVEAQKCLANVALFKGSHLALNGNEVGGGTLGEGYSNEAVNTALVHLNEGLRLAPQDVSIHQGRLHILEVAGRYDEMDKALEQSINTYKGPGTPDLWLSYAAELANYGQPTAGLHLSEVILKHYPDNPDVVGNLGAFYNMLHQPENGLPYLRRAVELDPDDAIDTWNLGWALVRLDQFDEADKWMARSLDLKSDPQDLRERKCLYGQFLVTKRKNAAKGCPLVRTACEADDQSVCKEDATTPALH
ncbi:MAG TPA: hypothetical protein VFW30_12190 [Bryocella sp.]|nr:hypothetical protein [Bryocella sp.]